MDINSKILITGAAGFIGSALSYRLVSENINVLGIDNLNNYYDVELKKSRLKRIDSLQNKKAFKFFEFGIEDEKKVFEIFANYKPTIVINLAAQAGVRYSIENPSSYIKSNLLGFSNILEACRNFEIKNFIYASSSSVYGGNSILPFSENSNTDYPISLYAATKKSNELMAHSYSHLYDIPSTGLRFFTVYGPWGRPDMAPMIFANSLIEKKIIKIFNNGNMMRDFTYIEDVVDAILCCCEKPAKRENNFNNPDISTLAPHMIFNVGNSNPIRLLDFIDMLEDKFNIRAMKNFMPIQAGDVKETFADISNLKRWTGFEPQTDINQGLDEFVAWYKNYFKQ